MICFTAGPAKSGGGRDPHPTTEFRFNPISAVYLRRNALKLAKLRRQVLQAADQAWPWRTPGLATLRKAFLLSPDRAMKD